MLKVTKPFNELLCILLFSSVSAFSVLGQETPDNQSSLISSETEIDYTELEESLQRKQWLRANEITSNLLLQSADREEQGWIAIIQPKPPEDELVNSLKITTPIKCEDLRIIDDLWKKHSEGKFGFTVQLDVFLETDNVPGRLVDTEAYDKFGDSIGWRNQDGWIQFKYNLNFSSEAPRGHLPNPRPEYQITGGRMNYIALTQTMQDCGMQPVVVSR
ncbi:MAG: GUN4 domain-containing protein [Crocosphaera sp.]